MFDLPVAKIQKAVEGDYSHHNKQKKTEWTATEHVLKITSATGNKIRLEELNARAERSPFHSECRCVALFLFQAFDKCVHGLKTGLSIA